MITEIIVKECRATAKNIAKIAMCQDSAAACPEDEGKPKNKPKDKPCWVCLDDCQCVPRISSRIKMQLMHKLTRKEFAVKELMQGMDYDYAFVCMDEPFLHWEGDIKAVEECFVVWVHIPKPARNR